MVSELNVGGIERLPHNIAEKLFKRLRKRSETGSGRGQLILVDKDDPNIEKTFGFSSFRAEAPFKASIFDSYDSYDFTSRLGYYDLEAYEFYDECKKQWMTNPFATMVVEWLINEIFGNGGHFEGDGKDVCQDFFNRDNTDFKIENMTRHAIMYGNGYLGLRVKGRKKLTSTQMVDTRSIRINWRDPSGAKDDANLEYEQLSSFTRGDENKILNKKYLIDFTLKKNPSDRYGLSLMRPNLDFLRSLWDIGTDIPAAVKRVAYAPIVMKLDLAGYGENDEKKAMLESFGDKYADNLSAVTNYIIDKNHEIELLGKGGGGAQLLPIRDLIEPLMTVVLINFGFPVGFFLQQGANKAIVEEQHSGVANFINMIKRRVVRVVNVGVIPKITNLQTRYEFSLPKINNPLTKRRLMLDEWNSGVISKEYYHEQAEIEDDGITFNTKPTGTERKQSYEEADDGEQLARQDIQ